MSTVVHTKRSIIANAVITFVLTSLFKAVLVSFGLRLLFPERTFEFLTVVFLGLLWHIGNMAIIDFGLYETVTTTTPEEQADAEKKALEGWLSHYGINPEDLEDVENR